MGKSTRSADFREALGIEMEAASSDSEDPYNVSTTFHPKYVWLKKLTDSKTLTA
jgi:hypothetical protein